MTINFMAIKNPKDHIRDDELCVILTNAEAKQQSEWLTQLMNMSDPYQSQEHYYLRLHTGYMAEHGKKPFIVVDWREQGNNALERRWLLNR